MRDEAHRLSGQPRDEFRTVLDEAALPTDGRVFLTATRWRPRCGKLTSMMRPLPAVAGRHCALDGQVRAERRRAISRGMRIGSRGDPRPHRPIRQLTEHRPRP